MLSQILAVLIFLVMFALIIWDKIERHIITLSCGALTLILVFGLCMQSWQAVTETLSLHSFVQTSFWYSPGLSAESSTGISWSTILFIAGMMLMVEGLAESGFFRWICMSLAAKVRYRTTPIFLIFMVTSALLSMFISSITVILFLAAVTIELARMLQFDPVPMILAEVFCANLGGAATMCGDPPNIIIGTALGYSFGDFVTNTGVIALVCLDFSLLFFYLAYRKKLSGLPTSVPEGGYPNPTEAITDRKRFTAGCIIFLCTVVLLITHSMTGLTLATIGVLIGLVSLLSVGKKARQVLRQVDWNTLLFFVGLFIVVGGLEQTKVLELLAQCIGHVCGGNALIIVLIIIWLSALASAFVDNIPFAATMVPVIKSLSSLQGTDLDTLSWALAIGTDIGGSATPIGASANVMGISIAAKNNHFISWKQYCTILVPATILVLLISTALILLRYF